MAQPFRHVLRGFDAAEVEAYVAQHRRRWWQQRRLIIRVRGDRIKASRPGSRFSQPPVLKGTVAPGPRGAVVEGSLHRVASGIFNSFFLLAALLFLSLTVAFFRDDTSPGWLRAGGLVFTILFGLLYPALVVVGRIARGAEADELRGALDRFFGLRS